MYVLGIFPARSTFEGIGRGRKKNPTGFKTGRQKMGKKQSVGRAQGPCPQGKSHPGD